MPQAQYRILLHSVISVRERPHRQPLSRAHVCGRLLGAAAARFVTACDSRRDAANSQARPRSATFRLAAYAGDTPEASKPGCSSRLPRLHLSQTNECLCETSHLRDRALAGSAVTGTVSAVISGFPRCRRLPLLALAACTQDLPDASLICTISIYVPHLPGPCPIVNFE